MKWGITMTIEIEDTSNLYSDYGITYEFWYRMEDLLGRNIFLDEIIQIAKRMNESEKEGNLPCILITN